MNEMTYQTWYLALEKPFFAAPPELFGIAWGIIYPLIFLALVATFYGLFRTRSVSQATLWLFGANLVLNVLFAPLQMGLQDNVLSSGLIVAILATLLVLVWRLCKESRTAFWLLVPYVLRGSYDPVLQISITVLDW